MMISPMPCSRWSRTRRSRICAWTVTSSAEVGSSAMTSAGRHTSAMAIIARWRSPPDSSNGYASTLRCGSGNPTASRASIVAARAACAAELPVQAADLPDLVADRVDRRERRHRLLEDHGDRPTTDRPHPAPVGGERREVDGDPPIRGEEDAPGLDPSPRREDPHDGLGQDALAGPRLPDDRHRLAPVDREGNAVYRPDDPLVEVDGRPETLDLQQRGAHRPYDYHSGPIRGKGWPGA